MSKNDYEMLDSLVGIMYEIKHDFEQLERIEAICINLGVSRLDNKEYYFYLQNVKTNMEKEKELFSYFVQKECLDELYSYLSEKAYFDEKNILIKLFNKGTNSFIFERLFQLIENEKIQKNVSFAKKREYGLKINSLTELYNLLVHNQRISGNSFSSFCTHSKYNLAFLYPDLGFKAASNSFGKYNEEYINRSELEKDVDNFFLLRRINEVVDTLNTLEMINKKDELNVNLEKINYLLLEGYISLLRIEDKDIIISSILSEVEPTSKLYDFISKKTRNSKFTKEKGTI